MWAEQAGFKECEIIQRFNSFEGTKSGAKVSPRLKLHGMNFRAAAV
jgi:hypothetical protein